MVSRIDARTGSLARRPERSAALTALAAALCGQRGRSDAEGESHRESNRRLDQHVNLLDWLFGCINDGVRINGLTRKNRGALQNPRTIVRGLQVMESQWFLSGPHESGEDQR
jgi:hypothetical protein